jgi:protein-tyrosine-phosphatase
MAEAILKRLVADRPDSDQWYIDSAGTWALYGSYPAPMSQFVMQSMGMDISSHQSKPVSRKLLQNFDLILTMESEQKDSLRFQFAEFANRIYMLSELEGIKEDIIDPIGGELSDYQATARELKRILSDSLDGIYQLTQSNKNM